MPGESLDEFGMLTGTAGVQFWQNLALAFERQADTSGWDQGADLFTALSPAATELRWGSHVQEARKTLTASAAGLDPIVEVDKVTSGPRPWPLLWGRTVGHDVCAVAVIWHDLASGDFPYADAREPVEVRHVALVSRSGHSASVMRIRGQAPRTCVGSEVPAALLAALARCLGATPPPCPVPVRVWLGQLALARAVSSLAALAEMPDPGPTATAAHRSLARMVTAIAPQDRPAELSRWATGITLAAVCSIAHQVLGTSGAPPELTLGALDPDTATLTAGAAARTWADQASDLVAVNLLPEVIASAGAWCGPDLAGWYASDVVPSQDSTLATLGQMAGPAVRNAASDVLTRVGWAPASTR